MFGLWCVRISLLFGVFFRFGYIYNWNRNKKSIIIAIKNEKLNKHTHYIYQMIKSNSIEEHSLYM